MELQRLDKIIASTGRYSRREVKQLARQGRILVDGRAIRDTAEKADPEAAEIVVNGGGPHLPTPYLGDASQACRCSLRH